MVSVFSRVCVCACAALALIALACRTVPVAPASIEPRALNTQQPSFSDQVTGRVALLDLWASWCEPCVAQFPKLERLKGAYADRGLVVLGVNLGEEQGWVTDFVRERKISYPIYLDQNFSYADSLGERAIPRMILLDSTGKIVRRTSEMTPALLADIRRLLEPMAN